MVLLGKTGEVPSVVYLYPAVCFQHAFTELQVLDLGTVT